MNELLKEARENIELRLKLNVVLGKLEEPFANLWMEAIRCLDDDDMGALIRKTSALNAKNASALMLKFLMDRHYPFREMVLYNTDDDFKRRMGIDDLMEHPF